MRFGNRDNGIGFRLFQAIEGNVNEIKDINYEIFIKSASEEIKVYMIQPELAESYDNRVLEARLQEESKGVKREKDGDDKKEESKPKRKVGR